MLDNNASDYSEQDSVYEVVLNYSYTAENDSGCKESGAESDVECEIIEEELVFECSAVGNKHDGGCVVAKEEFIFECNVIKEPISEYNVKEAYVVACDNGEEDYDTECDVIEEELVFECNAVGNEHDGGGVVAKEELIFECNVIKEPIFEYNFKGTYDVDACGSGEKGSSAAHGKEYTFEITEETPIWAIPTYTKSEVDFRKKIFRKMCAMGGHGCTEEQCKCPASNNEEWGIKYTSHKYRFGEGRIVCAEMSPKKGDNNTLKAVSAELETNDHPLYYGWTIDRSDNDLQEEADHDVSCIPNFKDLCRLS